MTTYARMVNGQAIDVITVDPATLFHPEIAETFVTVPDGTKNGARKNGSTWTAPPPPGPASTPALEPLTPMAFYLSFKPAERIAIKASIDPLVMEFWATYELAVQTGTSINPNLNSVSDGLAYLATPAIGILASNDRIAQILAGIQQ